MANTGADENNIESCLEMAMKKIVLLALKMVLKSRKKEKQLLICHRNRLKKLGTKGWIGTETMKKKLVNMLKINIIMIMNSGEKLLTIKEKDTDPLD